MVYDAVFSVIIFIIIICLGYFAARMKWAKEGTSDFVTKLVCNITLPATILYAFLTKITKSQLLESGDLVVVVFCATLSLYFVSKLASRIFKVQDGKKGVFAALFSCSNAGFIGFPVAMMIFGDTGFIYAVLFYLANTTISNSIVYIDIMRDGKAGKSEKKSVKSVIKNIISPPVIATALGFILALTEVKLPEFAVNTLKYLDGVTMPMSLFLIGLILHEMGISKLKMEKSLLPVFAGRFILGPLIMIMFCALLGAKGLPMHVFCVQAGLPSMVSCVIFAKKAGADDRFAAKGVIFTTVISLVAIPIYVLLFGI